MKHFESLLSRHTGEDFTDVATTAEVPAATTDSLQILYEIPNFFSVRDDNVNEFTESFAVVAEIGPDVSENFTCFQTQAGLQDCFGRRGATEIRILDNDRE